MTGWLKTDARPLATNLGHEIAGVEPLRNEENRVFAYLVRLEPSGWVLVAANDDVEPIIAFSEAEEFDTSQQNSLANLARRDLRQRMKYFPVLQDREGAPATGKRRTPREKWDDLGLQGESDDSTATLMGTTTLPDVRVPPLLESQWGQAEACDIACYNSRVPYRYRAGCVAVAMAQIMRYHEYPTAGIGRLSYTIMIDGQSWTGITIGGDDLGGPYQWSLMSLVPDCTTNTQQRHAIGALCYDAGVTVGMKYAADDSTTDTLKAATAMTEAFGYGQAVRGFNGGANIGSGLLGMINPNLDAGDPVILGVIGTSGHAVVCDGYGYSNGTLYHHLNMGWNGSGNAWYNLPNIDADTSYSSIHKCIYNIHVSSEEDGEVISGRVLDAAGLPIENASVYATLSSRATATLMTATTDARGIYAFADLGSSTSYVVTPFVDGYRFPSATVQTGTSVNDNAISGNYWGLDFTGVTLNITSITPSSGPSGSSVRIRGSNFGTEQGDIQFLGGGHAEIISWSDTTIYCRVPDEAVSGNLYITTADLHQSTGKYFRVTNPDILVVDTASAIVNMENGTVQNPFATIQQGIDAAGNEDTVLVSPGIYAENLQFRGRNITVQSLEPEEQTYVLTTVVDGGRLGSAVTFDRGEGPECLLTGFTITGGSAVNGGGILCIGSGPTISRCVILSNAASSTGGGIYSANSATPIIQDCWFSGNTATYGGAIAGYLSGGQVDNCEFIDNTATREGGAMHNNECTGVVTGCMFRENYSADDGGAVANSADQTIFVDCTFKANSTLDRGGAMLNKSSHGYILRSRFISNLASDNGGAIANSNGAPTFIGCVMAANRAYSDGGAMYNWSWTDPLVINCTISGNQADGKSGGILDYASDSLIHNTILWANVDRNGTNEASQYQGNSDAINHSCVQGWTGLLGGEGNTGDDPLLQGIPNDGGDGFGVGENDYVGNMHLSADSPCIDAANNMPLETIEAILAVRGLPDVLRRDLDAMPRFLNTPQSPDTGEGDGPIADMGACEYVTLIAHWKFDEAVGTLAQDSAGFSNGWLVGPTWQPSGGQFSGSLKFDGVDDKVTVLSKSPFDLTEAITVSAWINFDAVAHEHQTIIAKGDSAWQLAFFESEPVLHFSITGDSSGTYINSSSELTAGQWHHVCGTFDGRYLQLYIDGQPDPAGPVEVESKIGLNNQTVVIGDNSESTGRFWDGLLDDVRVYNYALSDEQIGGLLCEHPSPADMNGDCVVNLADFAIMSNQWLLGSVEQVGDIAPAGGDGRVDSADLAALADSWLLGQQ